MYLCLRLSLDTALAVSLLNLPPNLKNTLTDLLLQAFDVLHVVELLGLRIVVRALRFLAVRAGFGIHAVAFNLLAPAAIALEEMENLKEILS